MKKLFQPTIIILLTLLFGCSDDYNVVNEDLTSPNASFKLLNNPQKIVGEKITFEVEAGLELEHTWNFGDGTSLKTRDFKVSHSYKKPGIYTVELTSTSKNKLQSSSTEKVIIRKNTLENLPVSLLFVDFDARKLKYYEVNTGKVFPLFTVPRGPSGALAHDPRTNHVYYTDYGNERILRNTIDGQNEEVVGEDFLEVRDLELDTANNILYASKYTTSEIWAIDLDDFSKEIILDKSDDNRFGNAQDMELYQDKIFTVTPVQGRELVFRGKTDGRGLNRIIDFEKGGYGYSISVDGSNEKIIFNDTQSISIKRADLNGSNVESIINVPDGRVYGIAVHEPSQRLFWTTWGDKIGIANLDGSDPKVIDIEGADRVIVPVEGTFVP